MNMEEADISFIDEKSNNQTVSISKFFKYNSRKDNVMLAIGTMGAVIAGLMLPSIALIMGSIANNFGEDADTSNMSETIGKTSKLVAMVAVVIFVFSYIFFAFWQHLAENISLRLRKIYLRALLNQEIAYFEHIQIEQIPAQMGEIFETVQSSIGEKLSNLIFAVFTGIGGCVFAFYTGETYSLSLIAYLPVFFIILGTFGIMVKKITTDRLEIIKQTGGVVSETLYAIKVVASFGREELELEKFKEQTRKTEKVGKSYQRKFAFMVGIMKFAIFLFYTFSFYVGSLYIQYQKPNKDSPYSAQDVLTVLIALITGFLSLIAALPNIQAVQSAKIVGRTIFDVIDRPPRIVGGTLDSFSLHSSINFDNVSFKYPTAQVEQRNIFTCVSFSIKAGESTAIIGPSGYGKSTIVQMIERFYDPVRNPDKTLGEVRFDGVDIKKITLKRLRESIGYVPQEPTLIIGTIRENMLFGNRDAKDEEIEEALVKANAEFVFGFEKKLDTFIGTSSVVNLSGGQKQRLAIARALLKKPKILILDEATSALDPQSEKEVQNAIEKIDTRDGLTILTIAHRLTSIKNAKNLLCIETRDKICSYSKGTTEYDEALARLKNLTQPFGEGEEEEQEQDKIEILQRNSILLGSGYSLRRESTMKERPPRKSIKQNEVVDSSYLFQTAANAKLSITTGLERAVSIFEEEDFIGYRQISGREIMRYYTPRWMAILGLISSVGASAQLPLFGFILSKYVFVLMDSSDQFESDRDFWTIMFAVLCSGIFIFTYLQKLAFGYCAENLSSTFRVLLFEQILYKHIGWFDDKDRAPGILGNIIQEDITLLNGLTSETYAVALESILGLIIASGLCLYFSWQVGLIAIIMSPMMVFGGFFMSSFQWSQGKVDDAYRQSNALLSDIIMNYRTIISLGDKNVDFILEKYYKLLEEPNRQGIKRAHFSGILFGYSQSVRFIFVALSFYFAALIIENSPDISSKGKSDVFTAVYIMFVGAIGSGVSVSQMPSISKAKASAQKIFGIIEEKSQIDSRDALGSQNKITKGSIVFENVNFRYPSRRKKILDDFSLKINHNESVALVGHSGSGKSTIASLLLRFYNKQSGNILVDGQPIESFSVKQIRDQVAIVMQEPLLFNEAIKDNIRYGNLECTDAQIIEAARQANCLDFIQNDQDQLLIPEVKAQVEKDYQEIMSRNTDLKLLKQHFDRAKIEEKFLINDMLRAVNQEAIKMIQTNETKVLEIVQGMQMMTWQELVMKIVWKLKEEQKLKDILKSSEISTQNRNVLAQFIELNEWRIDEEALNDYIELFCTNERASQRLDQSFTDENSSLKVFLRKIKHRFEFKYDNILGKYTDKENTRNPVIHPGFNKLCGLRGSRLSGGQKQRVAIARALIRNPRVLILDEATSALDEKSQEIVQQALELAMKGRTSIVIAHRLSTVQKCDRIVVLHNGQVVEQGTYKSLSEDVNSYFFKLKAGLQMEDN